MPPEPFEFRGPRVIAEFYRTQSFWGQDLRLVPTRANNQPAYGDYLPDPNANVHRASGILVLTLSRDRISAITRFGDRGPLARFGLPRTVPSSSSLDSDEHGIH
jgi:RNA polymerase sigma-70 factor (ECF subfamily)